MAPSLGFVGAAAPCEADCAAAVRASIAGLALPSGGADLPTLMQDEVAFLVQSQSSNGSWPDINYNDPNGRSWWEAGVHLRRLVVGATAYAHATVNVARSPGVSAGGPNASAVQAMVRRGLEFWYAADPPNTNWWWNQLGTPRCLARALILLNESATSSYTQGAVKFFDRAPLDWAAGETGCNRVWGASVNVLRGALMGNGTLIEASYAVSHSAVALGEASGDGIQVDGSFHQHGPQLYAGWGYGAIFTANVLVQELYASAAASASGGTSALQLTAEQWETFTHLVLDGQQVITRGPNFDFEASGRLMTYFVNRSFEWGPLSHYHSFAAFSPFDLAFRQFKEPLDTPLAVIFQPLLGRVDPSRPRADEMAQYGLRIVGDSAAKPLAPLNRHYYTSDYQVHSRPDFMASVRMFSNRTLNSECVNDENKLGKALADGALVVYRTGQEFEGVYPVWNWQRIPGTTEHQVAVGYDCGSVQDVFHTAFVGGVSDGVLGFSGMHFQRGGSNMLTAFKTVMMLDSAAVAFGSGISSTGIGYQVGTSLDQRNVNGVVTYAAGGGSPSHLPESGSNATGLDLAWAQHNGLGYIILPVPEGAGAAPTFEVSNLAQTGSLDRITQGPPNPISKPVFGLQADHGPLTSASKQPAAYLYAITPANSPEDAAGAYANLLGTVKAFGKGGWSETQGVCSTAPGDGKAMGVVFWPEADNSTAVPPGAVAQGAQAGCWDVSASVASLVLVREAAQSGTGSKVLHIAVSNPMQFARPLSVSVSVAGVQTSGQGCDSSAQGTTISVTFPTGNQAGNSTVIECLIV